MSKSALFKIGRFEIKLCDISAISDMRKGATLGLQAYDVMVSGVPLTREQPAGLETSLFEKERNNLLKGWKETNG